MPRVSADINTLLLSADKAAARANLDLEPGTDVLAFSAAASQAEMEAGTEAALRTMSPLRVAQAIAALSSGGGEITVQDEGTPLATAATTINFVGAGVTASGTGATKTITISGASVDLSGYIQSDITGLTGATQVNNIVAITSSGYAAIGALDANTIYNITDAKMGDYGAFVAGQFLIDTGATDATGLAPGDVRYNNATQTIATSLFIAGVSAGGVDLTALLALMKVGNEVIVQDLADVANFQKLTISAAPSVSGGNWAVPVTVAASGGTGTTGFANNLDIILAIGAGQTISGYITPAALTSSASIAWNVATVRQPTLALAHNTTITLSNLADGQSVSLSGTMGGSGGYTVALAHSGLTARQMGLPLTDIAALAANDLFEIAIKRSGTDLRFWVSTLEI